VLFSWGLIDVGCNQGSFCCDWKQVRSHLVRSDNSLSLHSGHEDLPGRAIRSRGPHRSLSGEKEDVLCVPQTVLSRTSRR
jgi:hypothetical protein